MDDKKRMVPKPSPELLAALRKQANNRIFKAPAWKFTEEDIPAEEASAATLDRLFQPGGSAVDAGHVDELATALEGMTREQVAEWRKARGLTATPGAALERVIRQAREAPPAAIPYQREPTLRDALAM